MMLMMISFLAARAVHRGWGCAAAFQVIRSSGVSRSSFSPQHQQQFEWWRHPSRCVGHHMSASPTISCNDAETNLANVLKAAYEDRETDGVQDIIRSNQIVEQLSAKGDVDAVAGELVTAAVEASSSNKSLAAILNAILGSCCDSSSGSDETESINNSAQVALAILELIDEMHDEDESTMIKPDIVTLSLVYYSLCNQSNQESAQLILERAQQMSKKAAGSQRRRALAAERRKGSHTTKLDAKEAEKQLQAIYGPDIHILHESDDLIVLSKAAGQVQPSCKRDSSSSGSRVKKKYLALVPSPSTPSLEQEGVIDALVGGKSAASKYRVVSTYHGDESSQGLTLLEVETLTGRKHQPPAQASRRKAKKDFQRNKRGKADNTEDPNQSSFPKAISDLETTMIPGQEKFFLHAQSLSIPEFDVDVQAPLPGWWTETLDQLES
eukprot:scaffold10513_cov97-Skeletonema_marinoi.AAC.2